MGQLFLGLDASTQGLAACVLDLAAARVVHRCAVSYDELGFDTEHGVLRDSEDPARVHAPPLMWAAALDRLLSGLAADVPLAQLRAVAGAGQQHGTVYLTAAFPAVLAALDPRRALAEQLAAGQVLARATAPTWMDASTTAECAEIETALGGARAVAEATGSATTERFSGPQIRRFARRRPAGYARTARIDVVSSFHAALLAGGSAPIDHGDGSGMNLMDIRRRCWHPAALAATAEGLDERLPPLAPAATALGPVAPYLAARHGLSARTLAASWTGDNPSSAVGLGLVQPGDAAISLGTSDTYFSIAATCRTDPAAEGHVFVAPTGDYMTLNCFKNGSLARERIRDRHGLDWRGFARALDETPPGNDGKLLLPYFEPEIVPRVLRPRVQRLGGLDEGDGPGNCRAVVEAQMLAMRHHAAWMGAAPRRLLATGGASQNAAILQVMADVHRCPVLALDQPDAAALGAALCAAHGWHQAEGRPVSWRELTAAVRAPAAAPVQPRPETAAIYEQQLARYVAAERAFLKPR